MTIVHYHHTSDLHASHKIIVIKAKLIQAIYCKGDAPATRSFPLNNTDSAYNIFARPAILILLQTTSIGSRIGGLHCDIFTRNLANAKVSARRQCMYEAP